MKQRPILFSGAMVRALLDGSKTQTRRIIKPQPEPIPKECECGSPGFWLPFNAAQSMVRNEDMAWACPFGGAGNQIWVRETFYAYGRWETRYSEKKKRDEWHFVDMTVERDRAYQYAADNPDVPLAISRGGALPGWYKRPAIFMPHAVSRIQLDITGVRVERLNTVTDNDAYEEGAQLWATETVGDGEKFNSIISAYKALWESINGAGSWNLNPWVWVIEFKRVKP